MTTMEQEFASFGDTRTVLNFMEFTNIDEHVLALDMEIADPTPLSTATAEERLARLLVLYRAVRPILIAVAGLPLFPARWRAALTKLVTAFDQIAAAMSKPDFKAGKDLKEGAGRAAPEARS